MKMKPTKREIVKTLGYLLLTVVFTILSDGMLLQQQFWNGFGKVSRDWERDSLLLGPSVLNCMFLIYVEIKIS